MLDGSVLILDEPALTEAMLDEPVLTEAMLDEPVLTVAMLDEPALTEAMLDEPVLTVAMLDEPVLMVAMLDEPVLTEAMLDEPVLTVAMLDEPVLTVAMLDEPALTVAILGEPVLTVAMLDEPALTVAILGEPVLTEASLNWLRSALILIAGSRMLWFVKPNGLIGVKIFSSKIPIADSLPKSLWKMSSRVELIDLKWSWFSCPDSSIESNKLFEGNVSAASVVCFLAKVCPPVLEKVLSFWSRELLMTFNASKNKWKNLEFH